MSDKRLVIRTVTVKPQPLSPYRLSRPYLGNQRIEQRRSWIFEKINKIDKPLARLTRGHRDSILINKIRNKKGDNIRH